MEKFYVADLMRIVTDIVESARGTTPNWERLEAKGEDLRVLARAAMKVATDPGANAYPEDGDGQDPDEAG